MGVRVVASNDIDQSKVVPDEIDPSKVSDIAPPSGLLRRVIGDSAVSLAKGVIGTGESLVGIADIPTLGAAGKALSAVGYDPKATREFFDEMLTPEQRAANARVQNAKGFVGTIAEAVKNPSTIAHSAIESAPMIFGGGAIARGARKLAGMGPISAAALGEGASAAGSMAEQIRQETNDGYLTPGQAGLSVVGGAATAGLTALGGKVAKRLGIADPETALAGQAVSSAEKSMMRRVPEGAISEGLLEELPQSAQEQILQNVALGKPWDEGVGESAAMGMLTGGLIGGGMNIARPGQNPVKSPGDDPVIAGLLPAPGQVPIQAGSGGFRSAEQIQAELDAERNASDIYAARAAFEASQRSPPPPPNAGLLPGPGETVIPMPPAGPAGPNLEAEAADINAGAIQAHRDAYEREQAALRDAAAAAKAPPLALPAPGAPLGNIMLPNDAGPFSVTMQHVANDAQDHANAVEAAREAEIARLEASGPIGRAAAASMRTGAAAMSGAQRAEEAAGPAESPLAIPEPVTEKAKRSQESLSKIAAELPAVTLAQAQAVAQAATDRFGEPVAVIPHPSGRGFTAVPQKAVPEDILQQFGGIQRAGGSTSPNSPTSETVVPLGGAARQRAVNEPPIQPQLPIKKREAAVAKAEKMTVETGREHEVVPHPFMRGAFAVRPVEADEYTNRGNVDTSGDRVQEANTFANRERASDLDAAANEAATSSQNDLPNPTRAQSEAGNYRKGHVKIHGLDVSIENPRHSVRVARDGSWASAMPHHYGYIRRSEGADGDHVDTFIGPNEDSDRVYVVNQINPKTGKFDEHKVMLGFSSLEAAKDGYRAAYPKDWRGMGSVVETDVAGLKAWLNGGDTKSEFRSQNGGDRSQTGKGQGKSENNGEAQEANALTHQPAVRVHAKADPSDAPPPPPAIAKLVFSKPGLVVIDRHDGREIPGHLKKTLLSIIGDALRLGMPTAALDGVKSLYIKRKDTGAEYSVEGEAIGMSLDTLEAQYRGSEAWAETNVGNFIHEVGHHVSGGSDGESYVARSPAFSVSTVRNRNGELSRVARGVVMLEAIKAYNSNETLFHFLGYPLHNWEKFDDSSLTHEEFTTILKEEVFAQSWALYHTNPGLLRAEMPQTYRLMEEVANEARDSGSILEARQRVQQTLRSWRPEVGSQGQRGADQGDAGRTRVGQAGRGVEGGRGNVPGRKEARTELAADEPAASDGIARRGADERGAAEGVREDRQRRGSGEVAPGELRGDGRSFTSFFTDATTGGRRPNSGRRYEPVIDISRTAEFSREYEKHRGNFDDHIATSIPGFRETQQAVGNAILKSLPNGGNVLDIGASEGSFIKAISALSNGRIKTVGLDPNVAMAKFFAEHSSVPGSTYEMAAFGARADEGALAWDESDGTKIHYFKPKTKFDVAHEAMTFQFISNARDAQVARVKELLKPGGVALFEQKFIPPHDEFLRNEEKKDSYKAQYYSAAELERKKKDVLERGEKAVAQEEKAKEEKVVGMHDLMVSPEEFEKTLGAHFAHVVQYWDSGNFKGYAASDNLLALKRLASNIGDLNSEYSTTKTPRDVRRRPGALDVKTDVVYRGEHGERAPNDRAKVQTRLPSISFVNNRSTADLYSRRPNDRARDAEAKSPRVIEARLNIEKPVMDRADDPFIGLDDITKAVGIKEAKRIAVKFSDQIEATNNWAEEFSSKYDSVADLVAKKPSLLGTLYFDAYKYLDDAAEVSLLKSRGYDGAIHAGNGESADDVEYKVFSESQIEDAGAKRPSTLEAQDSGSGPRSATVGAERGDRVTGRKFLSGADKLKIARDGAKLGLSKKEIRDLQAQARSDMSRFPPKDGWVPIEIIGVERKPKTLSSGDVVYVNAVKYRPVPYKFNVPPGSERATGKIDEAWAKKVAAAGVNEILDVYRRAKAGDAVAQNIVAHASWYRAMVVRLREEFGAAGDFYADLLGATSPNTPVETNWRFAIDIIKRFSRGEFQTEMRDFEKWIADGRSASEFPAERKIRQLSEKLYGMNSTNGMLAIANLWRNIEPGMAPKARNFALNLIGQSNMATIDVWAARFLRRMANSIRGSVGRYRRIPTVAEQGVTGQWNASATAVTGEFGFGANVMQKMSDALAGHGIDLSPPDLQAVSWFVEKELWTKSGWTSAQGEGGSFEAEADKAGLERFMAAWSIQVGNNRPADAEVQMEAARLLATVRSDDDVTAARAVPTIGMYDAESHERSFDTEVTAGPNWSPWAFIGELSRIAKERKQDAIYFSRVLKPNEENDNARPGIEIYFKTERDLQSTLPLIRSLTADGQQGFTLTVDPRSEMPGGAQAEKFNGIRIQFVPEFEIRFGGPGAEALASGDRERVAAIVAAKTIELSDIAEKVMSEDGVALARRYNYDTLVVTKEDYDDYTDAATGDRAESSREGLRGGQPLHEVLADAARRYESGRREEPEADIPFGQADGSGRDPTGEGFYNAGVAEGEVRRPGALEVRQEDMSPSTQEVEPEPLWYSRLNAGLEKAPWSKAGDMPVGQLKMWLNARAKDGALPGEELKWSGVTEWIDTLIEGGNRRISRTEVEKFLDQNGVKVEEKMRGYNHGKPKRQVWVRYDNERGDAQIHKVRSIDDPRSEYRKDVESEIAWWSDENGNRISSDEARKIARAWEKYWSTQEWPKYDAHVLPGGENYAELLLKLPTRPEDAGRYDLPRGHTVYHPDHHYPYRWRHIDGAGNPIGPDFAVEPNTPQAAARFAADRFYGGGRPNRQPGAFRSAHFDEPNILAHVRFNERIDADGNRILFLEEVQSDWAQKGREEGFSSKSSGEVRESEHADGKFAVYVNGTIRIDGLPTRQIAEAELKLMLESDHHQGIPVAPFVTKTEAWVALALKRMIRYAADNGFDAIAWTNGEQQADRYDLSKQISEIKWSAGETRAAGFRVGLSAYYPEGGLIEEIGLKMYRPEELAGVIGKELSDRIRKSIDGGVLEGEFSGLDLKVGGEGMRAFYDKIVPNVANDLLKKMGGARVGEVALDDTEARDFRVWLPDVNEYHNRTFKYLSEAQDFAAKIGGVVRSPERATLTQPGFYLTPEILPKAKRPQALFAQTSLAERATETIGDALRTQRSFNLWDRTVGTQFHKAWKDPDFKKVYDGVQSYLNDASFLMTKAADLAPDVLPKLEGIRGILGATASKADLEAMSHAIFDGTLEDVVYTDDQLRSRGLSPKAIVLYRQTRAAIDKSLTDVFVSEAVKEAKGLLPADVLARARREGDPWIVVDALSAIPVDQRSEVQQQVYDQLRKRVFKIEELKQKGYAPLMRFGQYTVHMADANGGSLSFTMHETEREANAVARALRAENPQHRVTQGVLAEDAWQLFQGISPDTLEIFAESVGASEKQLFQKYLKLATNNRSTLRRLIQRKKIPGFSPDAQRALAQFVTSNGRAASRNYNWGAVLKAANDVPKERGDVKDEAVRLAQYVQHPGEEAGGLRGLLFVQFLGGSVASALTNATQPILMTFPYLSRFGAAKAAAELVRAAKVAVGGQPAEADLRDAMNRAAHEGIIAPHEVAGLYAESIRNLGSNLVVRRVLRAWGSLFSLAEAFNRRITFAAAYRLARDAGESDPYRFAVNAIAETQGVYNRGNRPDWARGAVGATIFTFKQYSIAYVEFVRRLPPKQRALALAVLVLAAGLQGLPGADDLEDVLDTIAESLGYSWNSKKAMREWAIRTLGNSAGGLLVGGFSGLPGVPIDVQARLGLGNLIPGTGLLKRSNPDKGREVLEVFGPAGSQAKSLVDAVGAAQEGNAGQVARSMLPLAIQNAMKAVDMVSTGYYSDTRGRRVIDVDAYEAAIKGIGVQPRRVGDVQRRRQDLQQDISLQRSIEEEVSDLWARGIIERDPSKIDRARAKLVDWNLTNPGSRVTISPLQIQRRVQQAAMTADQRFIKTAPPELRARVAEELR